MDNELLVTEFHKIIDILKEKGHISLFMLQSLEYDINDFNLIISTSEYDDLTTKQALMNFCNYVGSYEFFIVINHNNQYLKLFWISLL